MKRIWILACFLTLVAAASFALPPSDAPATLASIFAPAASSRSFHPEEEKFFASSTAKHSCFLNCGSITLGCSYTVTCMVVDQSCPSQRGYISCDGVTTYCPPCPECTEGSFKTVTTGPTCGCDDGTSTPKDRYECINGEWVYQSSFCGAPFCPGYQ
jgi:hypothetical protein